MRMEAYKLTPRIRGREGEREREAGTLDVFVVVVFVLLRVSNSETIFSDYGGEPPSHVCRKRFLTRLRPFPVLVLLEEVR